MTSATFLRRRRSVIPPTLQYPLKLCGATTVTVYILSLVTGNVSQVDRLWTFLPVIYSSYYAFLPWWPRIPLFFLFPYSPYGVDRRIMAEGNPRTLLMFGLQFIWMIRLSYNTWRRGLFNFHDEDYRWEILRQKIPRWLFQVFNLVFIAFIQNVLLFMLALPTHNAAKLPPSSRHLQASDYILAALSLVTLALEFTADNQQYSYQTHKRSGVHNENEWPGARINWTQEDVQRGFITRGLWAWSRHPNFACEQTFWILQGLFPLFASQNWNKLMNGDKRPFVLLIPPLALCSLFFSSTLFTESISLSKYPQAYKAYQRRVSMFIPFLTPIYGWILKLQGQKEYCDRLVYGKDQQKKDE